MKAESREIYLEDKGVYRKFYFNVTISRGGYLVNEKNLIDKNRKVFDFQEEPSRDGGIGLRISKQGNYCFVHLIWPDGNRLQFIINKARLRPSRRSWMGRPTRARTPRSSSVPLAAPPGWSTGPPPGPCATALNKSKKTLHNVYVPAGEGRSMGT